MWHTDGATGGGTCGLARQAPAYGSGPSLFATKTIHRHAPRCGLSNAAIESRTFWTNSLRSAAVAPWIAAASFFTTASMVSTVVQGVRRRPDRQCRSLRAPMVCGNDNNARSCCLRTQNDMITMCWRVANNASHRPSRFEPRPLRPTTVNSGQLPSTATQALSL